MEKQIKIPKKGEKYENGDLVNFYQDLHNDEGLYGIGRLIQLVEEMSPLTFITEDNYGSPRLQEVWSFERWELEIVELTELGTSMNMRIGDKVIRNLKVFARIGVPANSVDPLEKPKQYSEIVDNFEIVPGWGQCF